VEGELHRAHHVAACVPSLYGVKSRVLPGPRPHGDREKSGVLDRSRGAAPIQGEERGGAEGARRATEEVDRADRHEEEILRFPPLLLRSSACLPASLTARGGRGCGRPACRRRCARPSRGPRPC
jgi:hypothetical protein